MDGADAQMLAAAGRAGVTDQSLIVASALGCGRAQGFLLARPMPADDLSALRHANGTPLVRIYGPREPGPNSVRICSSYYEYEYRLSGTVIVPRENCYWSG